MKKYCLSIFLILFTLMAGLLGLSGNVENTAIRVQNFDNNDIYLEDDHGINNDIDTMSRVESVFLGGIPLGIDVKSRELIITSKQEVITDHGIEMPLRGLDIKNGDRLISIDGIKVFNDKDIYNIIKDKDSVTLAIERGGDTKYYTVKPVIDSLTHRRRLGLWLKDGITGIGTLTYIRPDRRYGALGHPIEENRTYNGGKIYSAIINDYIAGERGKAGELCGTYDPIEIRGSIDKNSNFGIFGTYIGNLSGFKRVKVANRNEVKQGRAEIYTTINGCEPKCYKIEIIKRNVQSRPDIKGMVIRIIDDELLDKTHGILQGMSGSPIIQNGKLIGAVTHVFINDPTKGFGVYSDFMLGN